MLVEFGRGGWLSKARQQPDKVRDVLRKIQTDGLLETFQAVQSKLDQPIPLGYCNAGVVTEVGEGVRGFTPGDRVASNGPHAEVVSVPPNLCARIPDTVTDEVASFTVLAAIGLQGVRLAKPTIGECFVVTGLGLVGLLTVQLLRAQGCRVLGIDFDESKLALARGMGAETVHAGDEHAVYAAASAFSNGRGVDGVILAAATQSNTPVSQAAQMCRKRGRIVLVGVVGLELSRSDFFEKELTFQVSCSYGPGRYDPNYEQLGQDYPIGFVRWTEQRNFEAVLDLMESGALDPAPLISHRFAFGSAPAAYDLLASEEGSLGILLEYAPDDTIPETRVRVNPSPSSNPGNRNASPAVAFIGSGNYAGRVLIPAMKAAGANLYSLANQGGVTGAHYAGRHGFAEVTTDAEEIIGDERTSAVVIATRHDSHARYVISALRAGKHVFCEKPLCLTLQELAEIQEVYEEVSRGSSPPVVMVGFNRRFAPLITQVRSLLGPTVGPRAFVMTVNAGAIPSDHWTQDRAIGGGRIIGEGCHFIDLLRFLADAPILSWNRSAMTSPTTDTMSVGMEFENGSVGTLHYLSNGHKGFPKERLEVFADGRVVQLDNFRRVRGFGVRVARQFGGRQDKGQKACAAAFIDAITGSGGPPIPIEELFEVTRVTIEVGS